IISTKTPERDRDATDMTEDKNGFLISDWEGLDRLCHPHGSNYPYCIKSAVNAGIDMVMVDLTFLVKSGEVPISRINDAVEQISRVKFAAGLFEFPFSDRSLLDMVGCKQHRDLAREAVRKSLVLLKNEKDISKPFLPLDRKAKRILVAGTHCGGWTKTWYGCSGRITIGKPLISLLFRHIFFSENLRTFVAFSTILKYTLLIASLTNKSRNSFTPSIPKSKCHKNFKMKRNPRKVKWTKAYRQVHGKDMTQDSTFEFERKRNRPERYDRNLAENVLKAIPKIEKIRVTKEERHHKNRMKGKKEKIQKEAAKELEQGISLVKSPLALQKDPSLTLPQKIKVSVFQWQSEDNNAMEE
ncbi:hypothetical protein S245_017175, partial [Arachis hypogaea]